MQFRGAISVPPPAASGVMRTLMSAPPSTHRLPMLSHNRSTKEPLLPATLLNGSCSDGIMVVGACAGPGLTWSVKGEPGRLADC